MKFLLLLALRLADLRASQIEVLNDPKRKFD